MWGEDRPGGRARSDEPLICPFSRRATGRLRAEGASALRAGARRRKGGGEAVKVMLIGLVCCGEVWSGGSTGGGEQGCAGSAVAGGHGVEANLARR